MLELGLLLSYEKKETCFHVRNMSNRLKNPLSKMENKIMIKEHKNKC